MTGGKLGQPRREPTELIEIRLVPIEEAMRMARAGEITDGPSALALLWCERLLRRLWRPIPNPTPPMYRADTTELGPAPMPIPNESA